MLRILVILGLSLSSLNWGAIQARAGDGPIVAWGDDTDSQCTIPWRNAGFVSVAAGALDNLGLKSDGTIVAWGGNGFGQSNVPSPNADFVAVAVGLTHALGLKSGGTVVAWGWNGDGQCSVPSPNAGFVAVAAGSMHSLGLKSDGTIVAWGWNYDGQIHIPSPNVDFVAIAAGGRHSLGLKSDGTVVAWGGNANGQCTIPSPNAGFMAVAGGDGHSLGLRSDGTVVAWGDNGYGQCNIPTPNAGFVAIAAGGQHSLGLKSDGTVVPWGRNNAGQCDVPTPNADFVAIAAGSQHSLGLKTPPTQSGACCEPAGVCVVVSSANCPVTSHWQGSGVPCAPDPCLLGACCRMDTGVCTIISEAGCPATSTWQGKGTTCDPNPCPPALDGSIVAWGHNGVRQCTVPSPNAGFVAMASGATHVLGLKNDGTVVAWGENGSGQCDVPYPNVAFVAVAGGWMHSLGLKSDGTIVAWGLNTSGEGDVPLPNAGFRAVAGGFRFSLGLKSDGTIVAWGDNRDGQCNIPSPNSDFVAIAAMETYALGLKGDGTVVAWGNNDSGQCDVPTPNTGFTAVSAGGRHSLGLKSNGSIVAWGDNGFAQCTVPSPNEGFVATVAGWYHSLGLKSDGTIRTWGYNGFGQCTVPRPNAGFVAIAAGSQHSVALNGSLGGGACCQSTGACTVTTMEQCQRLGTWQGVGSSCVPNPCVETNTVEMTATDELPADRYVLMSLPVQLGGGDRLSAALQVLGQPGPYTWRGFGLSNNAYVENPVLEPGQGFFLCTSNVVRPTFRGFRLADSIAVALQPGWNLVGCLDDGTRTYSWSRCQVIAAGNDRPFSDQGDVQRAVLWWEDETGDLRNNGLWQTLSDSSSLFSEPPARSNPWGGYLLEASVPCTLVFREQVAVPLASKGGANDGSPFSGVTTDDRATRAAATGDWSIRLYAEADDTRDGWLELGVSSDATAGRDGHDIRKPPSLGDGVRLSIGHGDWPDKSAGEYLTDIRGPGETAYGWDLTVGFVGDRRNEDTASLAWQDVGGVPAEWNVYLVTGEARAVDMRTANRYDLLLRAGESRGLTVRVSRDPWPGQLVETGLSRILELGPSPAPNDVNMRLQIGRAGVVDVSVFDVQGRILDRLMHETREPGPCALTWSPKRNGVASGVYFVKLRTAAGTDTRRVCVIRG